MSERGHPSISVSVPDADLQRFVREQAARFFGGKIGPYIVSLVEMDRREGLARQEMARRLAESIEDHELVAVS